jgi:uncharacterized protein with PhoU and TrkA domain
LSLESELLALLTDASQYDRDELIQRLTTYITDLVNKNTGPLKIDLHFAYLAREEDREAYSEERVSLEDRIEELESQLNKCIEQQKEEDNEQETET